MYQASLQKLISDACHQIEMWALLLTQCAYFISDLYNFSFKNVIQFKVGAQPLKPINTIF